MLFVACYLGDKLLIHLVNYFCGVNQIRNSNTLSILTANIWNLVFIEWGSNYTGVTLG